MRIQQGGGKEILLWKSMKINVNNNYFGNSVKKYTLRNQTIFMHQVSLISVGHIFIQNGKKLGCSSGIPRIVRENKLHLNAFPTKQLM